jgi:citrate lyase subunit beta/citryl-CoA lyase
MNALLTRIEAACTFLFVPALRTDRFEKALASGADLVIIDLEDAVPLAEKALARKALSDCWDQLSAASRCLIRVNGRTSVERAADLELCARLAPAGVMLPKVESAQDLDDLPSLPEGQRCWVPLIESARGWLGVNAITHAPGVARLAFGNLDFQAELDLQADAFESELVSVRLSVVAASVAAGLAPPIDGVTRATDDDPLVYAAAHRARRLGFGAKLCIHPRQIDPVRRAFAPSEEELAWARRVEAADDQAKGAAFQLDGQMIDRPVVLLARRILARARVQ